MKPSRRLLAYIMKSNSRSGPRDWKDTVYWKLAGVRVWLSRRGL